MDTIQSLIKTAGSALGIDNLTLWSLLRVAVVVLVTVLVFSLSFTVISRFFLYIWY